MGLSIPVARAALLRAAAGPSNPVAVPRAEQALVSGRITLAMLGADDAPPPAAINAAGDAVVALGAAYGGGMGRMPRPVRELYEQLCHVHTELRRLRAGLPPSPRPLLGSGEDLTT